MKPSSILTILMMCDVQHFTLHEYDKIIHSKTSDECIQK